MFESYESGRGLQIAKKLGKAYKSGRTDVYLTFLEKDFAGYLLENPMMPDKNIIVLEKIFKRPYKEMFDMYWDEKLNKSRR